MAEFTSYPPATPSWVDLSTPDLAGASAFYGALFGWEVEDTGPGGGGYAMFLRGGRTVAGMGPMSPPHERPVWTTYVTVHSADATVDKVRLAGGGVLVEPMDILDVGRMALCTDVTGATFALWQPRAHQGAQLVNEPGSLCWNELQTRDTHKAAAFYGSVFGWSTHATERAGAPYVEWRRGDDTVGGMMDMPAEVPPQVPAYWLVYFAVDDCDGAVAATNELGGTTLLAPTDVGVGRLAVLSDPHGAVFAVIRLAPAR